MKQIFKRVSSALLALVMVLSLFTQTAFALDPNQRLAERRDGQDVASIHYTDAEGKEQAIPFTESENGYVYTLPEGVDETKVSVEYFSTTRWDGAVDISWYNDTDKEFTLTTPAQLAGLAALVNGQISAETSRWRVKGNYDLIQNEKFEDVTLVGSGGGNDKGTVYRGLAKYDFADKVIKLGADMDMGGVKGSDGTWSGPNWTPIGGSYPMDITVTDKAQEAQAFLIQSYFNGSIDGQGHRIKNLYCNRYSGIFFSYSWGIGFIGYIGNLYDGETAPENAPTVRMLSVSGSVYGRRGVAGIVGRVGNIPTGVHVESCANYADVEATDSKGVGGVVAAGWGTGYILNCYNAGSVTNSKYACPAGGICGNNDGMDIYACYNVGQIESKDSRGRGIGGHNNGSYTVANCYYLEGCDNDPASNGWYKGTSTSCTIDVTKMTQAQMQSRELVDKLNASGDAFVYQEGGYPVLFWEAEGYSAKTHQVTVQNTEAITITASAQGTVADGTVVYLSYTETPGNAFRYFTVNGKKLDADYFTVTGDVTISAVTVAMEPGTIYIPESSDYTITVTKSGTVYENGVPTKVENYPVQSGDHIYENDVLTAKAQVKEGAAPSDVNYYYNGTFNYTFAYQEEGGLVKTSRLATFTATASQATLKLTAESETSHKVWSQKADTSWYNETDTEFTLTDGYQLAGLAVLVKADNSFAGKTIKLGADISLLRYDDSGAKPWWDGIGPFSFGKGFDGAFDGCGHTIEQMQAASGGSGAGLFLATNGAVIENLTVIGSAEANGSLAGIVSIAVNTTIRNCVSRVELNSRGSSSTNTGGIVGHLWTDSRVENCVNYGSVTDNLAVGGLVGKSETGSVMQDCVNFGSVNGSGSSEGLGGLVGYFNGGTLQRCANYGKVTAVGGSWYTGGIAGRMNSSASIIDCYNVADVVGGHTKYSNGGLGGIAGLFNDKSHITNSYNYGNVSLGTDSQTGASLVCDNIGAVIGNDKKVSGSKVDNVYYLEGSYKHAVMSGDEKRLTAVTAVSKADFAKADFLKKLNVNGCFVLQNGAYPELKTAAAITGGTPVLTVIAKDAKGNVTDETIITDKMLDSLASTRTAGYQYWKNGVQNIVAATKHVTLADLMNYLGMAFTPGMTVTAADSTGFGSTLSYKDYTDCRYFIDANGNKSEAPAALALIWNSGTGTLAEVAAGAKDSRSIRFCYGISESQVGSAAGKRLVSGIVTLTIQDCVHSSTVNVPEVPATCTKGGTSAGVKCADCGAVISGCEPTGLADHTEVVIPAVPPTETSEGWTAGVKCSECGAVLKAPEKIPSLAVVLTVSGLDKDGNPVTKGYNLGEQKALADTDPILGYQYSYTNKRGTRIYNIAAVEYVTLDKLLKDTGIVYTTGNVLTAGNSSGTSVLGYQQSLSLNNGVNAEGKTTVPVAIALHWGENPSTFAEAILNANSAGGKNTLRFCYGVGEEVTGEARLLDKVTTLTVSACAHEGDVEKIPGTPATCTKTGLTDGEKCLVCGAVKTEQTVIGRKPHTEVEIPAVEPTETSTGLTAGVKCSECGTILTEQQEIPKLPMVLTISGPDKDGKTVTKSYSLRQLKALADTDPIGYQYKYRNFTFNVVSVEYVTLEKLLADAGIVYTTGNVITAKSSSTSSVLGYQQSLTLNNGVSAEGTTKVPVAILLRWGENRMSYDLALQQAQSETGAKTSLYYCYGIGEELTAADNRLVDKVTTLTVSACAHEGDAENVSGTPATCTKAGLTDGHKCLVCGAVYGQDVIDMLGHDFGAWTVAKAASCTETGLEKRTCSRCQTPDTRVIAAKGHQFKDGKCAECGASDPNYQPGTPSQQPGTGDDSHMILWSVVLLTSAAAMVLLPRKKRS